MLPPEYRRLLAFFADTPVLRGALCRGHSETFDAPDSGWDDDVRARLEFARHACHVCPVLLDCKRWVDALPRDSKPLGVTAGVLRRSYGTTHNGLMLDGVGAAATPSHS